MLFLSFFGHGVRGDFGMSGTTTVSLSSSWAIWGLAASPVVSSVNHSPGLVVVIVFSRDLFGRVLKGGKSSRCSMLYNFLNLKQPSVVL